MSRSAQTGGRGLAPARRPAQAEPTLAAGQQWEARWAQPSGWRKWLMHACEHDQTGDLVGLGAQTDPIFAV